MPRVFAASASAAPWFPDECVTTPRAAVASLNAHTELHAPRNLNAPARWKFSHLNASVAFASASMPRVRSTGVRCACGAMRSAAWRTDSAETIAGEVMAVMAAMLCETRQAGNSAGAYDEAAGQAAVRNNSVGLR